MYILTLYTSVFDKSSIFEKNTGKADFSIFYGDGYIGIDAMTSYSGKVNVLVVEDEAALISSLSKSNDEKSDDKKSDDKKTDDKKTDDKVSDDVKKEAEKARKKYGNK